MPDLRSELEKVINAWEHPEQPEPQPEPQPQPQPTKETQPIMNTTKKDPIAKFVFDYIVAHPNVTTNEVVAALPQFNAKTIQASISGMGRRHLLNRIRKADAASGLEYEHTAAGTQYMTVAEQIGRGFRKNLSAKKSRNKRTETKHPDLFSEATTVRKAPPAPAPAPAPLPPMRSVFDLDVESLTIGEARALRDKLNALFSA